MHKCASAGVRGTVVLLAVAVAWLAGSGAAGVVAWQRRQRPGRRLATIRVSVGRPTRRPAQ